MWSRQGSLVDDLMWWNEMNGNASQAPGLSIWVDVELFSEMGWTLGDGVGSRQELPGFPVGHRKSEVPIASQREHQTCNGSVSGAQRVLWTGGKTGQDPHRPCPWTGQTTFPWLLGPEPEH